MKNLISLLTFFVLSLSVNPAKAHISDFALDSPYTAATIRVRWQLIDSTQMALRCADEYGYRIGDNELGIFGLRFMNLGQHDAAFPYVVVMDGNRLPDSVLHEMGLHWDSCHGHLHIQDWGKAKLLDACGNFIKDGGKIGLNMYDATNVFGHYLNTSFGAATAAWLSQYGVLDWSLAGHPPNDEYNGEDRLGMSAGHGDLYNESTWGNDIELYDVPNGEYYMRFILNASLYFNQGFNVFPDSFDIPVSLTGQYPSNRLQPRQLVPMNRTPVCCANPVPSAPVGLKLKQQSILSWEPVQGATSYVVYRALAAQAPGGWYVSTTPLPERTTTTTSAQLDPLAGKYFYYVTAKNCAGESLKSTPIVR